MMTSALGVRPNHCPIAAFARATVAADESMISCELVNVYRGSVRSFGRSVESDSPAKLRAAMVLISPSIRAIQEIGGDYARTDLEGNYELHGADRGDYFVLVISRRGQRSDNDPPRRSDVAQIGRYFTPTLELLSQKQYRWLAVNIGGDETRNVTFE